MELQLLYNRTQQESKLNDDSFLIECLEFYQKTERAVGNLNSKGERISNFYTKLVETTENSDTTDIDPKSETSFYVMMTNIWIQNIMSLTNQEIEKIIKQEVPKYKEIKEIVSRVKKVSSMEEVISLYNSISEITQDEEEIDKKRYFWRFDQEKKGVIFPGESNFTFYHIQSRYVNARKTNNIDHTDYRLYINCKSEDIFELISIYVKLCMERQIPYYFKFGANKRRMDKFIIYCPKELLSENIEILKEIARIKPNIRKKCGNMLKLVGNIDNWIGIASEPRKIPGKGKYSFNTMRSEILEDAAELLMINFAERHKGKNVVYDKKTINFDELIAIRAMTIIMKKLIAKKEINKDDKNFRKYIDEILKDLLTKKEGISKIESALIRIREVMPEKNNLMRTNDLPIFIINLSNGKKCEFSLNLTDALLKSLIDVMKEIEPQYIEQYRQIIKEKCIEYQVDPENFAFNESTKNEFKQLDEKAVKNKKTQVNSDNASRQWNEKNYDIIMDILSIIPEQILMLKIENNITLKQYFQEEVVERMDEKGNYINDDGISIPVTKIIGTKIKELVGYDNWNENNLYYVNGIISTISEDVLNLNISEIDELKLETILYNDIKLKQYFQEQVVGRMDERQNYITFNGEKIPVNKYILSISNKLNEQISKKR